MLTVVSQFFKKKTKVFLLNIILLSIVNSVLFSAILIFINQFISNAGIFSTYKLNWVYYSALLIFSLFSNRIFHSYMINITNNILFEYEKLLLQKLRSISFRTFETVGAERIYTALGDIRILSQFPQNVVNTINSLVILICGVIYMFFTSFWGGAFTLLCMCFLLVLYLVRNNKIEKDLNVLRDLQNDYYKYLKDLLLGFKEMKMSKSKSDSLFDDYLFENRDKSRNISINTSIKYVDNELIGSYSWYLVLGVVLFAIPLLINLQLSQLTIFIVTILFLMGPIAALISSLPYYTSFKISFERVNDLQNEIIGAPVYGRSEIHNLSEDFNTIRFENVTFEYNDKKSKTSFIIDPINLTIAKGEVIFITGANGSGKSTFVNLLTGLYQPLSGCIYLDERPIKNEIYSAYRNKISAIFTNNYLFEENYDGFDLDNNNEDLMRYVNMLNLSDVIKIDDKKKQIDNHLSKGQQKRLAMIYALLEKRQIIVLDEWAAEQDPENRAYFYNTLLPEFKKLQITVVAITHDDAYFSVADRILKFEYGQIVSDIKQYEQYEIKH